MANESNILKEFLVAVGFKVDEDGFRRFQINMQTLEQRLSQLAIGAAAVSAAIIVAVDKSASAFEKLANQSQRTNTSVKDLQALGFAASQFGSTMEEVEETLEGFSKKLRDSQGWKTQLQQLGVNTSGSDAQTMVNLMDQLAKMPTQIRNSYLNHFGFSEKLFYAIENPGFKKAFADHVELQRKFGLNADEAAKKGQAFEQRMRDLGETLTTIRDKFAADFFDRYGDSLKGLNDWLKDHSGEITTAIDKFADVFGALATVFAIRLVPPMARLMGLLTGLSSLTIPAWLSSLLGLPAVAAGAYLGSTSPAGVPSEQDERNTARQREQYEKGDNNFRGWWRRNRPSWLGWLGGGGDDSTHVSPDGARGGGKNSNFTKENADAIRNSAARLGTTPEDLATVIAYETGGKFSTSLWGGKGGRYQGLIQFGPSERQRYGASGDQTLPEQMGAVERYLKDRGFKPGMGILDLYSTINAGRPGRYDASDGNGTVRSHVARMIAERAAQARAFLASGQTQYASGLGLIGSANASEAKPGPFGTLPVASFREMFKTVPPLGTSGVSNAWNDNRTYSPTQHVTVHVDGAASPVDTANAIGGNLRKSGSDLVRNMSPVAQ